MATVITSECINCGACEPECPNTAIYQGGMEWEFNGQTHAPLANDIFYIVPEKCTECVGFHDQEACAVVCPVDCCVPNPEIPETEEVLIARAKQLHPEVDFSGDFPSRFKPAGGSRAEKAPAAAVTAAPRPAPVAPPAVKPAAAPTAPPAAAAAAGPQPAIAAKPAAAPVAKPAAAPVAAAPRPAPVAEPVPAPVVKPEAAVATAAPQTMPAGEPAPAPAPVEKPVAAPKAAPPPKPVPRPEKVFAGELPITFEDAVALLKTGTTEPRRLPKWVVALLAPIIRLTKAPEVQGSVGLDGFTDPRFEEKLERERRYGEVYRLHEEANGFLLEMEFPRRVPLSAVKEALGVPDEMPDYDYDLSLRNGSLTVKGKVPDPEVRKIAAFSPAFPPDFETHIRLPSPVKGFKHRFRGKDLEVALVKQS